MFPGVGGYGGGNGDGYGGGNNDGYGGGSDDGYGGGNSSINANNTTDNHDNDGYGYGSGSNFTADGRGNVYRRESVVNYENGRSANGESHSFGEIGIGSSRNKRQSGTFSNECTEGFGYGGYSNGSCAGANDENQITIENILNKTILSKTNVLIFTFVTDGSVTDKGWNAIWESVTPGLKPYIN